LFFIDKNIFHTNLSEFSFKQHFDVLNINILFLKQMVLKQALANICLKVVVFILLLIGNQTVKA